MISQKIYDALHPWMDRTADSAYSAKEIRGTLEEAEQLVKDWDSLLSRAWKALEWEAGDYMNGFTGYASDAHMELGALLAEAFEPSFSVGKRSEPFPVKTWKREIARTKRDMKKLEQAIEALPAGATVDNVSTADAAETVGDLPTA